MRNVLGCVVLHGNAAKRNPVGNKVDYLTCAIWIFLGLFLVNDMHTPQKDPFSVFCPKSCAMKIEFFDFCYF